jgi:hypothetical protein
MDLPTTKRVARSLLATRFELLPIEVQLKPEKILTLPDLDCGALWAFSYIPDKAK